MYVGQLLFPSTVALSPTIITVCAASPVLVFYFYHRLILWCKLIANTRIVTVSSRVWDGQRCRPVIMRHGRYVPFCLRKCPAHTDLINPRFASRWCASRGEFSYDEWRPGHLRDAVPPSPTRHGALRARHKRTAALDTQTMFNYSISSRSAVSPEKVSLASHRHKADG
jgi:hypothetical protein